MARNIRDRRDPENRVVHVTNRVWEGLPFVPNVLIVWMIKSVLGRAQSKYGITICLYLFMGNHYHMIIAGNANNLSPFMNYVDGEIAKRMQRLFPGRWGPKFWHSRFKEQLLATPQDVINKIAYICCNPLKACLVSNLREYPGASSIDSVYNEDHTTSEQCPFTFPRHFQALNTNRPARNKLAGLVSDLKQKADESYDLKTDLFAWVKCFKEEISTSLVINRTKQAIAEAEQTAKTMGVIGAENLINQPFDKKHRPERKGITPFLECCDNELRQILIESYKQFRNLTRKAWELVKGGLQADWPEGSFIPTRLFSSLPNNPAGLMATA